MIELKEKIQQKINEFDELRKDMGLSDNTVSCVTFAMVVLKELIEDVR